MIENGSGSHSDIVMVTASLGSGGAERVMTMLANEWVEMGKQVRIINFDAVSQFYVVDDRVEIVALPLQGLSRGALQGLVSNFRRVRALRRVLRELSPDVVVSFGTETNVVTTLAAGDLGLPVVISERCDPAYYPQNVFWRLLRRWVYPLANLVVVQTRAVVEKYPYVRRIKAIPNPVRRPKEGGSIAPTNKPYVLAAGRLVYQKGFDVLIRAFSEISRKYPDWSLVILGDGLDRKKLERMAREQGIQARVQMPGTVSNPGEYMHSAEVFVLSSRFEGFPNVLCEAMASGTPVVATDCPSGPSEIVRDEEDGILIPVDDVAALTLSLERLMKDGSLRQRMGNLAVEITDRYSVDGVTDMWKKTLEGELNCSPFPGQFGG